MDTLTFLQSRGIKFVASGEPGSTKHNTRGFVNCACPLCGGSKLWLGYSPRKDYFHCWNHGFSSKYELFRAWFPSENPKELLAQIDPGIIHKEEEYIPNGKYLPPSHRFDIFLSLPHLEYIGSRGLAPKELQDKWKVEAIDWCPEYQYSNRLFFPVCNHKGVPVSWLTRAIEKSEFPYLKAKPERELLPCKSMLYGEQFVTPFDTVIVVEGIFDKFRIGLNAVATFGKSITKEQFNKIAKYQRRIICFDNEKDTQNQARELATALSVFPGITDNVVLDAPDPALAPQEEIGKLLQFAEIQPAMAS